MPGTLSAQRRVLAVLCGGFLGTIVRYGLSQVIQNWLGKGWPYDILVINLTGALSLALIQTLADATVLIGPTRRLLLTTGFLGAYTTFSTLALGDILLFSKGEWIPAIGYLIVSAGGGIGAVLGGDWLGQFIAQHVRGEIKGTPILLEQQDLQGDLAKVDELALSPGINEFESQTP